MGLNRRQLPDVSTPGRIMSNTSGVPPASGDPVPAPSQEPPQPSQQPPASSSSESSVEAPAPSSSQPQPQPTTSSASNPPPAATSSGPPPAQTTTSNIPSSSQPPPSSSRPEPSSQQPEKSTSLPPPSSAPAESSSTDASSAPQQTSDTSESVITTTSTNPSETSIIVITQTRPPASSTTSDLPSESSGAAPVGSGSKSSGLSQGSTVAIGVVVPIVAIAILAIIGLFWWKKRRARMLAEEERRKEVEDYSYNPNADPTIPSVAMMSDNGYEMREDGSAGYRGWGTTVAGSTGRKASTTISGGIPYSDTTSPTYGNGSEARSGEPLFDSPHSGEGEILGAMGPSAANNRGGDVHRGPSNASSSYSAAGRSDGSDGPVGMAYGSGAGYYDSYSQNPYSDNPYGSARPQEAPAAPVIRDNPARRNTRIENPSHYPQGSVGISQNF